MENTGTDVYDSLNYHPPKGRYSYAACNQEDRKFDLTVSFACLFPPIKGKKQI